jgi:hypothetical protein
MGTLNLKKIKLPLSKKKFSKLRNAIRTGRVKWMDMSKELMFSYQDFWKSEKHNSIEEMD